MKRLLVVDDESPVVDHIVRTVERELAGEFLVHAFALPLPGPVLPLTPKDRATHSWNG